MVRNPRVLLMCGLLATATALALGGGAVPAMQRGPSTPELLAMLVPGLGLWSSRAWVDAGSVPPPAAMRPLHGDLTLDGTRQPRGPRMPREARDASR